MKQIEVDVLIVGGGVAGLWCLNRLVQEGYNAILFEKRTLGGAQTCLSQGIIHGGAKYTLNGMLSGAASAIGDMPSRWRNCLQGTGDIDLRDTRLLSDAHYLWSNGSLSQRMTGFFASKAMRSRTQKVSTDERPAIFRAPGFRGQVYRLDELVLDTPSLVRNLSEPHQDRIFQIDAADDTTFHPETATAPARLELNRQGVTLMPKQVLLTAGEGYADLAKTFSLEEPEMQVRPLHMALVSHQDGFDLFAHCIGASAKPLLTVTTHRAASGRHVWYLGGELAESGVDMTPEEVIERGQSTLRQLLPWITLKDPRWRTVRVNRAEPKQSGGVRPDTAFVERRGSILVTWPTKLALSPNLADRVLEQLDPPSGTRSDLSALQASQPVPVTATAWEDM